MSGPHRIGEDMLPGHGSPRDRVHAMTRVDHAGAYGARGIYEGQLAVLGATPSGPAIRHMARQEERHLGGFDALGEDEAEMRATIEACRAQEAQHGDTAVEHGARAAPGYGVLSGAIGADTRLAIRLSGRARP